MEADNLNAEEGRMSDKTRRVAGVMAVIGCVVMLGGCDWWPPALQQRIGQQDAQIKTLGTEKTALQGKVTELTKAAEDCKAQSAQAAKAQADLQAQVAQLKADLDAALAKKGKPGKK
jgi:outer membrane murein-binding lipoprotein Lpp